MEDPSTERPETLDGYRLIRLIGRGGFGEVWLCRSEAMGDYRALKWIPATSKGRLEKEYESLLHYRKAAAALRSPSLLAIEHVGRTDDGLYYVMPLADGVTDTDPSEPGWIPLSLTEKLREQTEAPGWFSSAEVIALMIPVLDGLQILTEAGLVHRDVKPDNILFFHGKPCLGDISLLGMDAPVVTRRGTPGYATPSWYLGGHPDMYGAAATLYSLLTGNEPDKMGRSAFLWPPQGETSLSPREHNEWKRLHGVIRRAAEEEVSERFVDFAAMRVAVVGHHEAATIPMHRLAKTLPPPQSLLMNWYYLNESGEVAGPLSDETLKELNAVGALKGETHVCREGTEVWTSLAEVLGAGAPGLTIEEERTYGTKHAKERKSLNPKIAVAAVMALLMLAGGFFGLRMMGVGKDDNLVTPKSEKMEKKDDDTNRTLSLVEDNQGAKPESAPPQGASPTTPVVFVPPKVDRSPRDGSKGGSSTEDARLAFNSLAWFTTEDGSLSQTERSQLGETLARINLLISNENSEDFEAAAKFVDACIEKIPALKSSSNARLAKVLFLFCDGDEDQARKAESDPDLQILGSDSLGYRVELMDRLRMDPSPLLSQIISSPDSDPVLLVQALVERARYELDFGGVESARSDLDSALSISVGNPSMQNWVEEEARQLRESNPKLGQ